MKDDDFEAIAAQEDPIVMYLIVRESLGMGPGKTAAQCAHAAQILTCNYFQSKEHITRLHKQISSLVECPERVSLQQERKEVSQRVSIMGEWLNSAVRKVVLRASDKEWKSLKEEFKNSMALVVDAGLTEIPSGSETVIGLWPMRKSQVPKVVKRLQILK